MEALYGSTGFPACAGAGQTKETVFFSPPNFDYYYFNFCSLLFHPLFSFAKKIISSTAAD